MSLRIKADKILDWYGYSRQQMPFLIKRPLGYFFYITARCNLSCDYCWQRERPDRKSQNTTGRSNELRVEEWIKIIKAVPRFSFIGLTGGEPLLYPGFMDIIKYLGGRFPYTVNTNGVLLDNEILENLIKFKASNISISLDGFSDVHDPYRKKAGLFDHIVKTVERLNVIKKKAGLKRPSLTIKTVLLDPVMDRLIEFYRFCNDTLKADCLNISIMKTVEHAQYDFRVYKNLKEIRDIGEPMCYQYNQGRKIFEALTSLLKYSRGKHCQVLLYPKMYGQSAIELLYQSQGRRIFGPCYVPWALIVILADGTVIPCLSVRIANIREMDYDIKRINSLEKYQDFLRWRAKMNHKGKSPAECNMCCFSSVKL